MARSGTTPASGRTTSSPPPTRSRAISSTLVASLFRQPAMDEGPTWPWPAASCRRCLPSSSFRLCGHPVPQRRDHGPAPCRHLQRPQDDEGPRCGLQGPDRDGGLARVADHLRAMPADPSKQVARFTSINANFPGITLDWTIAQDAPGRTLTSPTTSRVVPNYAEAKLPSRLSRTRSDHPRLTWIPSWSP